MKPGKNKSTVSKLKKQADKVFSIYIRLRDGGVCITCPEGIGNQAGHFQSRRFNSTRYDQENVNGQCSACNVFRHGEQYKYALAVDLKFGDGTAEKLSKKSLEYHKFTTQELQAIIQEAENDIKFYEQNHLR